MDCSSKNAVSVCSDCGSNRILASPDLSTLSIAHIDCDAFYASIEKRDNPDLAGLPVLVGGSKRGVVATCCYIARAYGVRSAMPMFKALKLCPDAVVIKPRMDIYAQEGRAIREMMQRLTPLVEPVSIDEAYLDLNGSGLLHKAAPVEVLVHLQKEIRDTLHLSVSVGLSSNKYLAKIASELDKPNGFSVISPTDAPQRLAPLSARAIHGVGPKLMAKLETNDHGMIADLQAEDRVQLMRLYGETGIWLHKRAFGLDDRPVSPTHDRKSISSETTFNQDITDINQLTDILWRQCIRVGDSAKRLEREGRTVTIKVKTDKFQSITRQISLNTPTQLAQSIFRNARPLLENVVDGRRFRLLGVGISDLSQAAPVDQPRDFADLADPKALKRAAAERAMDKARAKFGKNAVDTGRGVRYSKKD
ncbi:MAG: DNA polymerase IV [Hirschia sp.]|nr:DNA polymerase IV [Hirschia sp.]MBF17180.1 DNA polymerase IV [Hirschia sp.]